MTEETKNESKASKKLLVDDPSDFQFHAAYLKYSDAYDEAADPEVKKQLNQSITLLQQNQIDYPTFYQNISQQRSETSPQKRYRRTRIKSQRKREWRRKAKKREREKRHRTQ